LATSFVDPLFRRYAPEIRINLPFPPPSPPLAAR
jgi:hypothetical protein